MGRVTEILDKLPSANQIVDPGLSSVIEQDKTPVTRTEFNMLIERLNSLITRSDARILIDIPVASLGNAAINIADDSGAPGLPTSVSIVAGFQLLVVKWTNPSETHLDIVEVWRSADNDSDNAAKIGELRGIFFIDDKLANATTFYYWLKSRSFDGTASAFHVGQTSGASGTTLKLAGADVLTNEAIITNVAQIANAMIATAMIQDLAVNDAKIAALAVTEAKIGAAAVTQAKIGLLAVDTAQIAAAAIESAKIKDLAVDTLQLAGNAVTTLKVTDLNVTEGKIEDNGTTDSGLFDSTTQEGLPHTSLEEVGELTVTASGEQIGIHCRIEFSRTGSSTLEEIIMVLKEGTTEIARASNFEATFIGSGATDGPVLEIFTHRVPSAGSVTYNLEAQGDGGLDTIRAERRQISVTDWKK